MKKGNREKKVIGENINQLAAAKTVSKEDFQLLLGEWLRSFWIFDINIPCGWEGLVGVEMFDQNHPRNFGLVDNYYTNMIYLA